MDSTSYKNSSKNEHNMKTEERPLTKQFERYQEQVDSCKTSTQLATESHCDESLFTTITALTEHEAVDVKDPEEMRKDPS